MKKIFFGLGVLTLISMTSCKKPYGCNCNVDIPGSTLSFDTTYYMGIMDKNEATAKCSNIKFDLQSNLDQNPDTQGTTASCFKMEQ
jgi:hypothetical protein